MPLHTIQYSFNGGEVSELFLGRTDINRYFSSLGVCENYITLPKGGVTRRNGTQFIAEVKDSTKKVRLETFEFSVEQAYVLEFGELYVRFYQDLSRLEVVSVPVEITTPYLESQLFDLQFAQSADVLYVVHPSHPPAKISRLSATSFQYDVIKFRPAPLFEKLTDLNTTLTPGATTGTGVTFTAGSAVFLDADIDRQIVSGTARAVITALGASSPSTTVTCTILSDFPSTSPIAAGSWFLDGSPAATLRVNNQNPVGAEVTLTLEREQSSKPDLVTNGNFSSAGTGWTNHSGALVSSGTADAGSSDTVLFDASATFQDDGVEVGYIAKDLTAGVQDTVTEVVTQATLNTTTGGSTWPAGNSYEVRDTGTASFSNNEARLNGGVNGFGWIEQGITTTVGVSYQVQFDTRDAASTFQIGSASKASDVVSEASFAIKNENKVTFVATSTTSYIQFRNSQNFASIIDNVSAREVSADGFRSADVGKLVNVENGTIEITRFTDATSVVGVIWANLDMPTTEGDDTLAVAGFWILGEQAWTATNGYPRGITFHDGRLAFLGTSQQPLTVWLSVVGLFENFALGTDDDDAVAIEISANQMNTLEWGEPFRDLLVGTRGGEHLITGGTNPITPSNHAQVPQDTEGSPPLRPLRAGNSLIHVTRDRRRIRELKIDADTGLSESDDLTLLADHITKGGVKQWAYQRHPYKQIWAISGSRLIGYTFELSEDVRGWHRHPTTGTFESVAVVPVDDSSTEESSRVWVSTKRTVNSVTKRFIEVMRPLVEDDTQRRAALTLDSAIRYSGAATTTITGLSHLDGESVNMVAREATTIVTRYGETLAVDRLVNLGTATVASGQVTTPVSVTNCDVGINFISKLETLPPDVRLEDGTLIARKKRWAQLFVKLHESISIEIDGTNVEMRTDDDLLNTNIEPRTEDITEISKGWTEDGRITIRQTLPFPSTVLAIVGKLEFEEGD